MQTVVIGTLIIWIVWFALMLVPAYWFCRRFVPAPKVKPHPLVYLILAVLFAIYSKLAAMIVLIVVMTGELFVFGPTPLLAHLMNDLTGYGVFLTILLFFVPTFAALIVGYRKWRRESSHTRSPLLQE
jgi:hypothetical protein